MTNELLGFTITGKAIRSVLKQLRPAFPKKAQQDRTVATITVQTNHVTFRLPGAAVGIEAVATKSFIVELPFSELKILKDEPFKPDALIAFGFEPKRMVMGAISIGNERIHVTEFIGTPSLNDSVAEAPASPPVVDHPDEIEQGFIGYPLLGIYQTLRKHPPNTFSGNRRLQAGEHEIDEIMKKIDRLLKPLGLGRDDIVELLDKRIGLKK